jgi:hypothetical protein
MWRDWDYPDLCPLIHLLVYIYLAGIKLGCIFPPDKDLLNKNVGTDGNYTEPEKYKAFLNAFKKICDSCLVEYSEDGEFKCTLHVFRKGAYCFRIWAYMGKQEQPNYTLIRYDARHLSEKISQEYIRDAEHHGTLQDIFQDARMKVSYMKAARFESLVQMKKLIHRNVDKPELSLPELAAFFVSSLNCGKLLSPRRLLEKACSINHVLEAKLQKDFERSLTVQQLENFRRHQETEMKRWYAWFEAMRSQEEATRQSQATRQPEGQSEPRPAKKARKQAPQQATKEKELNGRKDLAKLDRLSDKIDFLLKLEKDCPPRESLGPYSCAAKKWIKTTMRPILKCFRNHHGSNAEHFAEKWKGGAFKADFLGYCCDGNCKSTDDGPCSGASACTCACGKKKK